MLTIDQQIEEIQKEIRETPYHKGTERHIGILKAKIAKLKVKREAAAQRGSSGRGISYAVKKQGDATVVLVGPPSAGKSTLLNALTNAESKVAPYAFTTVSVIPGMMRYQNAYIQVLDVPGLIEGAEEGKGRGREVLSIVRGADLLILVSDVARPEAIKRITSTLERNGIRINKTPPDVIVKKKLKGGLTIKTNIKQELTKNTIREIADEMEIKSAEIQIKQKISLEELIDSFAKNRVYIPAISVLNKADTLSVIPTKVGIYTNNFMDSGSKPGMTMYISAETGQGLDELKKVIWEKLGLVKIYLVDKPMIVKKDITLADVINTIGTDFAATHRRAKIWGPGAKFPGQEVSLSKEVVEGMQVRFI